MSLTRKNDYETSIQAAYGLRHRLNPIRRAVHAVYKSNTRGLTDEEMTSAMWKAGWPEAAESTYRKRRTELFQDGFIQATGEKRRNAKGNLMVVWAFAKELPPPEMKRIDNEG